MAHDFDPYYRWLGIPPDEQPPHHYRLLGIKLFESNPDVIETAADRQMLHIQTFKTGQHSALSQKLLNELSAAKLCLLNPQNRAAYDEQLQTKLQPKATAAIVEESPSPRGPAITSAQVSAGEIYRTRQTSALSVSRNLIVGGVCLAAVAIAIATVVILLGPPEPELLPLAEQTIDEGNPLYFDLKLKDAQAAARPLEYQSVGKLPEGAYLDRQRGRFSWTPSERQGPGKYDLRFRVVERGDPEVQHETAVAIAVAERPQRPRLEPIDTASWGSAAAIDLQLQARDIDLPASTLVYNMSIDPAPGESPQFDARTGRFQWTPQESDRGKEYRIEFSVWKEGHLDLAARQLAMVSLPERPAMLAGGEAHRRLLADLADAGLTLEPVGEVSDSPFRGRQRQMKLQGQPLDVIEYESDEAATADARQLTAEAKEINGKPVRYAHTPRFFRRGALILVFAGDNAEHLSLLERLLGRPIAEGKNMVATAEPPPAATSPAPMPRPSAAPQATVVAEKSPIPPDEDQDRALTEIRGIYKERYKSRKADDRIELVRELMQKAAGTVDDRLARFAFLSEARNVAQERGDVATAWQAIDLLAQDFQVEPLELKGAVLEKASAAARQPLESRDLADRYLTLMEQAVEQERFDQAIALASDAAATARRSKERTLIDRVQQAVKEARDAKKHFEAAEAARKTLAEMPDDPQANLALGSYLALVRGEWDEGLPLLAKSDARKVAAAAKLDLAGPATAEEQVAAGDAWWTATDAPKGIDRQSLQRRAAHWYRLAMPQLSALERIKLEQKLSALTAASATPTTARNPRRPNVAPIAGLPPLLRPDDPQLDRLATSVILRLKIGSVSIQLANEERGLANESEIPAESFTLKSVAIQHAMANDQVLAYLRGLKGLERLSLDNGQGMSDAGLALLAELPQLKVLTLQLPQISDASLGYVAKAPQLEQLVLQRGQFTDVGLAQLAGHARLTTLHCQSDLVSDEAFRQVAKVPGLSSLTLQSDRITAAGLPHLRSLTNLRHLQLRSSNLNDTHLAELLNQPQWQSLALEGNVGDAALATVGKLQALQSLTLDSARITPAGFAHLGGAAQLTNLSLGSHGPVASDEALEHLAGLTSLVWLHVPHGEQVTDAGMEKLARLAKLQSLTLQNAQFSDAGLVPLTKLPQLQYLAIDNARRITDRGLANLKDASQLRHLQVIGTQVTDSGVQSLKQYLPDCYVAK